MRMRGEVQDWIWSLVSLVCSTCCAVMWLISQRLSAQVTAGLQRCGMRVPGAWGNGEVPQTRLTQDQDSLLAPMRLSMAASRSALFVLPIQLHQYKGQAPLPCKLYFIWKTTFHIYAYSFMLSLLYKSSP